jgi:hypothetical protein
MPFAHYRVSTIGIQLEETLQELLNEGVIDVNVGKIIRKKFDKAIVSVIEKMVKDKPMIKGKLKHYQNCDNVWVFQVLNPEIRVSSYSLPVQLNEPLKIIACDNSKIFSEILSEKNRKKESK